MESGTLDLGSLGRVNPGLTLGARSLNRAENERETFASILGQATGTDTAKPTAERARDAARQFVSVTLVQPLLKQLRDSNSAAAPFAPSQGEKQFQSLMDADLALKITSAAHFPLVDRLAEQMGTREAERQAARAAKAAKVADAPLTSGPGAPAKSRMTPSDE